MGGVKRAAKAEREADKGRDRVEEERVEIRLMNEITVASDKVVAFPNAREGISDHVVLARNKLHLKIETPQLVVHLNVVASECRRRHPECLEEARGPKR
jgi:hypothetical protein